MSLDGSNASNEDDVADEEINWVSEDPPQQVNLKRVKMDDKRSSLALHIVGVNGSGKSSVFSAISWCLGGRNRRVSAGAKVRCIFEVRSREGSDGADVPQRHTIVVERSPGKYWLNGKSSTLHEISTVLNAYNLLNMNQTRWYVKQAKTVEIATQGPQRLLALVEDVVGTAPLRALIKGQRESITEMQARLAELNVTMAEHCAALKALKSDVEEFELYEQRRATVSQLSVECQVLNRAVQLLSIYTLERDIESAEGSVRTARAHMETLQAELGNLTDTTELKKTVNRRRSEVDTVHQLVAKRALVVAVMSTRLKQMQRSEKAASSRTMSLEKQMEGALVELASLEKQQSLLAHYDCVKLYDTAHILHQAQEQRIAVEVATQQISFLVTERKELTEKAAALKKAFLNPQAPAALPKTHHRATISSPLAQCVGTDGLFLCEICVVSESSAFALNSVLAGIMGSTVIVQTRSLADDVVSRCRDAKAGIITCEILEELPQPHSPLITPANCLLHQLTYPQKFLPVLFRLLRSWVIVESAVEAEEIMEAGKLNAVTYQGDMYRTGGVIVAGSNKLRQSQIFTVDTVAKSIPRHRVVEDAQRDDQIDIDEEELEGVLAKIQTVDSELEYQRMLLGDRPAISMPPKDEILALESVDVEIRNLLMNRNISAECAKARARVATIREELNSYQALDEIKADISKCQDDLGQHQLELAMEKREEKRLKALAREAQTRFQEEFEVHRRVTSDITAASNQLALFVRRKVKLKQALTSAAHKAPLNDEEEELQAQKKVKKWQSLGSDLSEQQTRFQSLLKRLKKQKASLRVVARSINPVAIQTYVEHADALRVLTKHFDFLQASVADESAELEAKEKARYDVVSQALVAINRSFGPLFAELSIHGEATLEFVRDRKVLFLEGVLILVKPDATCFKPFGSLSGGQRAMTALCFILALQEAYPSPIFLLDEIDAALDITAASRAACMIRNHAEESGHAQFLCVSLRHQFYAKARRLVGVYTTGVTSKTVCLKP